MRKINRRLVSVPQSLRAPALRSENLALEDYYSLPSRERTSRRAPFDETVLLREGVVDALNQVFRRRCAFCEDEVLSTEDNISHFRPARGIEVPASSNRGSARFSSDHYGWFAYEWRNLLVVCPACRKIQGARFPVRGTLAPVLCTWSEANDIENVELLDPCVDDPLKHLSLLVSGELVPLTSQGQCTVDLLALNSRFNLKEQRARSVSVLKDMLLERNDLSRQSSKSPLVELEERRARPGAAILAARGILDQLEEQVPHYARQARVRSIDEIFKALALAPRERLLAALQTYSESRSTTRVRPYRDAAAAQLSFDKRTGDSRIRKIEIKAFKGISDLTLDFMRSGEKTFSSPCVVLLGENAVGKSSVLQALCLTLSAPSERRRLRLRLPDFMSHGSEDWKMGQVVPEVRVELDDGTVVELTVDSSTPSSFKGGGTSAVTLLAYGARRYFESNKQAKSVENKTLFDPLATIADATPWLQQCSEQEFDAVARAMSDVLSLQAQDRIFRAIDGRVMVRAHGRNTPISQMSDGYKSLFAMTVDIMCQMVQRWTSLEAARGVVLIDEIETHLHPRWKLQVMGALRKALPQVQFIVTTHDPLCLRGMGNNEVIVLNRDAAGVVAQQQGLPSVVGLRAEQLLTSDYFGLVSTTAPEMDRLLDQYVEAVQDAGQQVSPGRDLKAKIAAEISSVTTRGDTVSQQLAAEAVARYLAARRAQPLADSSAVREDAVQAILAMLNKKDGDAVR